MNPPLFYLLIGDSFLSQEKRKEILAVLKKNRGEDLPVSLRRAAETPVSVLLSEARTLPFLASAQVICVRGADGFKKSDLEIWETYFKAPHPGCYFIFEAEALEKNHPFFGGLSGRGNVYLLETQKERMTGDFIQAKLRQNQKTLTPEARGLLESRLGGSPNFLDSLLDQLVLYVGEKKEIDRAAVEAFEERLARFDGFDLTRALVQRNLPKALEILNDLLELSGQDVYSLVGLLHWQLRRFWEAKRELARGAGEQDVAAKLRIYPSRDPDFFRQLRRFSAEELEKIIDGLFELDWRLKSGRAEGRNEVENWLVTAIG